MKLGFSIPVTVILSLLFFACTNQTNDYKPEDKSYTSPNIGVLRYIPSGTFQRDSTPTNTSYVNEYRISDHEITRNEYSGVTGLSDPSDIAASTGNNNPVQMVTWYHALVFCNKLSLLEGLVPVYIINGSTDPSSWGSIPTLDNATWNAVIANWTASGYRLPTEMEWMWAAIGASNITSGYLKEFSGDPNPYTSGDLIDNYAWTINNSSNTTHAVMSKLANEAGLFDMSGNVFEWCWDFSAPYPSGPLLNYKGAAIGTGRITRGGAYQGALSFNAPVTRDVLYPYEKYSHFGFRVTRN